MTRVCPALLVAFAFVACGPGPLVRRDRLNPEVYALVERGIERARGLRFTAPVPAHVLDDAAVARLLDEELTRSYQPGDLERLQAVYTRLGLLPADRPLRQAVLALYQNQLAALYDPRTKVLAIRLEGLERASTGSGMVGFVTGRDLVGEMLVAHELTHALQDQHFGLPIEVPRITDADGDRLLAHKALIEGDATLAAFAYLLTAPLDAPTATVLSDQLGSLPADLASQLPDVPDVLRTALAFQYQAGAAFVAMAFTRGGWPAVDDVYRDLPASSEQILHPARYFDHRDPPIAIALAGTEDLEVGGWTRSVEDTLGEVDIRVLARRGFDPLRADAIADGWGGDRLRALARGDDVLVVWLTAWDTVADAVDFAAAMVTLVPEAAVERRDERVLVLVGPAPAATAANVWRRSTVGSGR